MTLSYRCTHLRDHYHFADNFLTAARQLLQSAYFPHERLHGDIYGGPSMNDQEILGTEPSRREFLAGTGVAVTAAAVTGLVSDEACAAQPGGAVAAVGPGAVKITLNVNGREVQTNIEPRVTLLDALRNYLD